MIEDVVNKVCDDFLQSNVDESVLHELQGLWEMKMMQYGAILGPIERSTVPKLPTNGAPGVGPTPVHDLNVPYEPTEEYEAPTAEMLFPPQAPSPWMNQRPLGVDVNVAYVEGREEGDRGNPPQPTMQDFFMMSSGKRKREDFAPHFYGGGYIPQQDGAGDGAYDVFQNELYPYQGVASEDYNTVNTPAPLDLHAGTPNVGTQNDVVDDDDEPLNENDDDDLDDADEGEEPNTQHLVLAQFDKVTRTKSRWKCTLKDGLCTSTTRTFCSLRQLESLNSDFVGKRTDRHPHSHQQILDSCRKCNFGERSFGFFLLIK